MNPYQVIRIVCLLSVIFVMGLITGRLTAPPPPQVGVDASGRPLNAQNMIAAFKARIPMNAEEELKLYRFLEEIEPDIAAHPPLSQQRLELFRRTATKMKEIMSPDKHEAIDRYSKDMERRFENYRRRRGYEAPASTSTNSAKP